MEPAFYVFPLPRNVYLQILYETFCKAYKNAKQYFNIFISGRIYYMDNLCKMLFIFLKHFLFFCNVCALQTFPRLN
jgi:hypothetical protein